MSLPREDYDVLRELADRQRAEAARRHDQEQERLAKELEVRRQRAAELPRSSLRFDQLREVAERQRMEEAQRREGVIKAQQEAVAKQAAAADQVKDTARLAAEKIAAERLEAQRIEAAAAKAEQDRQDKMVLQNAARAWKINRDQSPGSAYSDVSGLMVREERVIREEQVALEKQYPGDHEKLDQHRAFGERRMEAFTSPHQHLQGKTPEQIKELAYEGFKAAQERDFGKPSQAAASLTWAQLETRVMEQNRTAAEARARGQDGRGQLRPEQATTDTRGLGRGDDRSAATSAPGGEMTDRRQRSEARPKVDRQAFIAQAAAQTKKEATLERGDEGRSL